MITNILCFKNKLLNGVFTSPHFVDVEPEKAAIQLKRAIMQNPIDQKALIYKGLILCFIGTFDDDYGTIKQEGPIELLDCDNCFPAEINAAVNGDEKVA